MLKYGLAVAVTVAVTSAVNMDIIFIPVMIQMKQNNLPGNDLGELSPYLLKKKLSTVKFGKKTE